MKKFLEGLIARKKAEIEEIRSKIKAAGTADEVRSLGETLDKLMSELNELQKKFDELDSQGEGEGGNGNMGEASRGFNPLHTYGAGRAETRDSDSTDSLEYRTAFMNFILRRQPIPAELRADENTLTTNVSSVIPTQLVGRIIERMDECGMILPLVSRSSFAGGIVIPTSATKPVATWVSEGAGSDRQKKTTGSITFSHFKLRCEISMSLEVGVMALSAFESKFVENVANAMTIAIEKAIINGNGTSQPKGILKETPAATVTLKAKLDYADLIAVEQAIPSEFESTAKWCLTKANFLKLLGMTDTTGQPIARVNYGISGKPERSLLGRDVVIVPYATEIGSGNFGFLFNFSDYLLNTIYDLGISTKDDWETEDKLAKAVMSVDGKVTNAGSLILVKQAQAQASTS